MKNEIIIKQANMSDILILEEIYFDVVNNFDMWTKERLSREGLLKEFSVEEFYIAYINENPAGCVALQDYVPFFWHEPVNKSEALFLRRLAVKRFASGQNFSKYLIEHAVNICRERKIKTLRLDCDTNRIKLCKLYEDFGFILEKQEIKMIGGKEYYISYYYYDVKQ